MSKRQPIDNLGMRQQALNARVQAAVDTKVRFEDVKDAAEDSEVDRLFKIDLAAKYKELDYIVEVLKSADSLYTTRALKKSLWLFDDEFKHIISPDYLDKYIFPFTSNKMKRLILTHVALHVRNEDRATMFYSYCIKTKLLNLAVKFLIFTSESFKLALLKENKPPVNWVVEKDQRYLNHFLQKSFDLLTALLEIITDNRERRRFLEIFQFWYKYDSEKYLDLVEKYERCTFNSTYSKNIMEEHKKRVLDKPLFYIGLLDGNVIKKYSTADDAKIYALDLLPKTSDQFWRRNFYNNHRYLLELIPKEETFAFLKKIYKDRYPDKEFETTLRFYEQNYYVFMTDKQQEEWAWKHIKSEKQILGVGRDYIWYGFVNFKDAFEKIKSLILITKETQIRSNMLKTLIKSAKTNVELKTLFDYYQKKHLNEARNFKDQFLLKVIEDHNVYDFDESCWKSFFTLLLSMDLYNELDYTISILNINDHYKTVAVIYHIVNEKDIADLLIQYIRDDFQANKITNHLKKLTDIKRNILYEYLYSMYTNKILDYKDAPFTRSDENKVTKYFNNMINLMTLYHKKQEPVKRTHYQPQRKERRVNHSLHDRELLRRLKKDSDLIIASLPEVTKQFETTPYKIDTFLKKIKLYFADDISKKYLELFENNVGKDLNMKGIEAAVNGIFQLGDAHYKVSLMNKYAPENNKVDYSKMDPKELRIQKAVCRYFCRSRPPMPLRNVLMYLKGDYVKHCLHIFNMFHQNLSLPLCLNFVESIIDAPVSLQKHGVRLAFACFDVDNLVNVIKKLWKNSKNVTLRDIMYKALFEKVKNDCDKRLFEILKEFTLDLNELDENELFDILVSNKLAEEFLSEYNVAAWKSVCKFRDREPNIQRKVNVLCNIRKKITLMEEMFVKAIVLEHLEEMFNEKKIYTLYGDLIINAVFIEKWKLVEAFIIHATSHSKTPIAFVTLTAYITQVCLESWNELHSDEFVYKKKLFEFIRGLKIQGHIQENCDPINAIPVFETIITEFQNKLSLPEIYLTVWDLRLSIAYKKVTHSKIIDSSLCYQLGKEVGGIVVDFVRNNQYITYMSSDIKQLIEREYVNNIRNILQKVDSPISSATGLVLIASGLTEQETTETYVLALQLLAECDETMDTYEKVLIKVSQSEDPNVRSVMHQVKMRKYLKAT
ncbi:unnamed protein product [Diatraea saccharalis]|uniref:Uncharacterized protein n=1 Tax=Diatraea saccharalis TaxID=40085 RepID=A0A9N9RA59_9NEOP|nr:unnamed protein product [Diatraea saccharalis]